MTLKLFGHDPSPYVRRTRVLLHELGIRFERDAHGWLDPVPEFLDGSPTGRLPMLDLGPEAPSRYVYDSRVIAEVIYELPNAKPAKDVQATLFAPALAHLDRNVVTTLDEAVGSGINVFLMERDDVTGTPYIQRQNDRVKNCFAWLEKVYEGRTTLTPGVLSYADMAVVCGLGWFRFRKRANIDVYPNLVKLEAALGARESFASTKPT